MNLSSCKNKNHKGGSYSIEKEETDIIYSASCDSCGMETVLTRNDLIACGYTPIGFVGEICWRVLKRIPNQVKIAWNKTWLRKKFKIVDGGKK